MGSSIQVRVKVITDTFWWLLYREHQEVVEERCELEEAENDSRLQAQN